MTLNARRNKDRPQNVPRIEPCSLLLEPPNDSKSELQGRFLDHSGFNSCNTRFLGPSRAKTGFLASQSGVQCYLLLGLRGGGRVGTVLHCVVVGTGCSLLQGDGVLLDLLAALQPDSGRQPVAVAVQAGPGVQAGLGVAVHAPQARGDGPAAESRVWRLCFKLADSPLGHACTLVCICILRANSH